MRRQKSTSLALLFAALLMLAPAKSEAQVAGGGSGPGTELKQPVVLYDEDPADPKGRQYSGSVVWRVEPVTTAAGQQDVAVQGDIEVPDRKLKLKMTLQRNFDRTLPASHAIELGFKLPPDFVGGGIGNIPGVLMKSSEQARGTPLSGLAVKVVDGFFLFGLSNVGNAPASNLDLLRNRAWIDIPLVYLDRHRAILMVEKSNEVFQTAITAWERASPPAPVTGNKP